MAPLKFDNGIYPLIPATNIELGDYGYWKGAQWCPVGNICNIPGFRRTFTEADKDFADGFFEDSRGVEIAADISVETGLPQGKAQSSIQFKKKGAIYVRGILKLEHHFVSLDGEIKPFLIKLHEYGRWDSKFWVAYSVVKAEQFLSLRSNRAGICAKVNAEGNLTGIGDMDATGKFSASASQTDNSIESITYPTPGIVKTVGYRFLSLERKHLFSKRMTLTYRASEETPYWDSEDIII
ncbi:MAG: hypothetical protein HDR94_00920 [Bacteroides sp.]|nr:hypothetical protein [Bacteroidales bacterium]MBD5340117.1 hypothetical protein [Bacteroides sp.]